MFTRRVSIRGSRNASFSLALIQTSTSGLRQNFGLPSSHSSKKNRSAHFYLHHSNFLRLAFLAARMGTNHLDVEAENPSWRFGFLPRPQQNFSLEKYCLVTSDSVVRKNPGIFNFLPGSKKKIAPMDFYIPRKKIRRVGILFARHHFTSSCLAVRSLTSRNSFSTRDSRPSLPKSDNSRSSALPTLYSKMHFLVVIYLGWWRDESWNFLRIVKQFPSTVRF